MRACVPRPVAGQRLCVRQLVSNLLADQLSSSYGLRWDGTKSGSGFCRVCPGQVPSMLCGLGGGYFVIPCVDTHIPPRLHETQCPLQGSLETTKCNLSHSYAIISHSGLEAWCTCGSYGLEAAGWTPATLVFVGARLRGAHWRQNCLVRPGSLNWYDIHHTRKHKVSPGGPRHMTESPPTIRCGWSFSPPNTLV